jgi:PPM family protein phosphatase
VVCTAVEGQRPEAGEDRVQVFDHPLGRVVVVADGVGGRAGGAAAADLLVRTVGEASAVIGDVADADAWTRVLVDADRRIAADSVAGETTAVVVGVSPSVIGGTSVGDSGAWLLEGESITDLTGLQHRKPYVGSAAAMPVPFRRAWSSGATLLVASDGLLKYADRRTIAAIATGVSDFDLGPVKLIDLVRLTSRALQDDVAVTLCRRT